MRNEKRETANAYGDTSDNKGEETECEEDDENDVDEYEFQDPVTWPSLWLFELYLT
jgi:hypothetical protein